MKDEKHTVFLGLGGNVGDVQRHMHDALGLLQEEPDIDVVAVSSIYKTPPWGKTDQNWFLNACARLETGLSPQSLMQILLKTEGRLDRVRQERWGPRTIDLDILMFGDLAVATEALTIPHPRMVERAFVLKPLLEVAGDLQVEGKAIEEWLSALDSSTMTRHCDANWFEVNGGI